jgi:hypothetical protein
VRTPVQLAIIRVDGKRIMLGGREQSALDFHQPGLKDCTFADASMGAAGEL